MWLTYALLISVLWYSEGYPSGPPKRVCRNGMPVHMKDGKVIPPQNSSSPFIIEVNATTYQAGDTIQVKVRSYTGEMFRGLFLKVQAIPNEDDEHMYNLPVGIYYRNHPNVQMMTCRIMMDSLSHKDSFMKIEVAFDWRAPLLTRHDVVVKATILKDFDTYWHNVKSPRIKLNQRGPLPVDKLEKPWLEEIIKTVKAEDDVDKRRALARARFERGFKDAIDPNGFIMVNYVTNLLPFEDSPVPRPIKVIKSAQNASRKSTNRTLSTDNAEDIINQTSADNQTVSTDNAEDMINQTSADNKTVDNIEMSDAIKVKGETLTNDGIVNDSIEIDDALRHVKEFHGEEFSLGLTDYDHAISTTNVTSGLGLTHSANTSMMRKYYLVLVKGLLRGDKHVADALSNIIEDNLSEV